MAYPGQGFGAAGSGSMSGGTTATNLATAATGPTVASYLSDVESCVRQFDELLGSLSALVDQVNGGQHRPPTTAAQNNIKQIEEGRSNLFARLSTLNKRLSDCNERFQYELHALSEQLPK